MMRNMLARAKITPVPAVRWVHGPSGRQASVYGAVPWVSQAEKDEWKTECRGWTWRLVDCHGSVTFGLGRTPVESYREALRVAAQFAEESGAEVVEEVVSDE